MNMFSSLLSLTFWELTEKNLNSVIRHDVYGIDASDASLTGKWQLKQRLPENGACLKSHPHSKNNPNIHSPSEQFWIFSTASWPIGGSSEVVKFNVWSPNWYP